MSGPTEAISPPDIIFKGTDGDECEAFVVAIRDFAFATGRDGDHSWLLRFATTRLRGKALRWHARLNPSIANDWSLFVQALFDQYPSVEEAGEAEIATPVWSITTFSPGPSTATLPLNPEANRSVAERSIPIFPNAQAGREESRDLYFPHERTSSTRQYEVSSTGQQIGILCIISADVEGTSIPQYVWRGYNNYRYFSSSSTRTTLNRHEALVISFLPSSAPHAIGCLNSRGALTTLALDWHPSPTQEYYKVVGCHSGDTITTPKANASGFVAYPWNILEDGTLQASLPLFSQESDGGHKETRLKTTEVHVNTSGDTIRFVRPGALLEQDKPNSQVVHPFVRARIVFEPL